MTSSVSTLLSTQSPFLFAFPKALNQPRIHDTMNPLDWLNMIHTPSTMSLLALTQYVDLNNT